MYQPVLLYPALSVPLINFISLYFCHTVVQLIPLTIRSEIASTFHFSRIKKITADFLYAVSASLRIHGNLRLDEF